MIHSYFHTIFTSTSIKTVFAYPVALQKWLVPLSEKKAPWHHTWKVPCTHSPTWIRVQSALMLLLQHFWTFICDVVNVSVRLKWAKIRCFEDTICNIMNCIIFLYLETRRHLHIPAAVCWATVSSWMPRQGPGLQCTCKGSDLALSALAKPGCGGGWTSYRSSVYCWGYSQNPFQQLGQMRSGNKTSGGDQPTFWYDMCSIPLAEWMLFSAEKLPGKDSCHDKGAPAIQKTNGCAFSGGLTHLCIARLLIPGIYR